MQNTDYSQEISIEQISLFNKYFQKLFLTEDQFYTFIKLMLLIALIVFLVLFFISAGYGKFRTNSKLWGIQIPNKISWILMESPVFIIMTLFYIYALQHQNARSISLGCSICLVLFQIHYFQRSFIFPLLLKGKGKMPISIMLLGATFNICNGLIQGNWLFNISSVDYYDHLFESPSFYLGVVIFFAGMIINIHSDYGIQEFRKNRNLYFKQKHQQIFISQHDQIVLLLNNFSA